LFSFEFATNEYVNDMTCVTLETSSTESGIKDFIAVGTTIDRGEDLAAKGAVRACHCLFADWFWISLSTII
jgi:cleavage and polyadenylation specificity factor subunit 1